MAYVVARRNGRFEVRESLHTSRGPRARSLAGFDVLTHEVLATATARAQRPFDVQAVIRSGRRAGAPVRVVAPVEDGGRDRFLAGSRRMAAMSPQSKPTGMQGDPGTALRDLLGFADAVTAGLSPRPFEPLAFPVLARLAERSVVV